jgi:hypothetical protein
MAGLAKLRRVVLQAAARRGLLQRAPAIGFLLVTVSAFATWFAALRIQRRLQARRKRRREDAEARREAEEFALGADLAEAPTPETGSAADRSRSRGKPRDARPAKEIDGLAATDRKSREEAVKSELSRRARALREANETEAERRVASLREAERRRRATHAHSQAEEAARTASERAERKLRAVADEARLRAQAEQRAAARRAPQRAPRSEGTLAEALSDIAAADAGAAAPRPSRPSRPSRPPRRDSSRPPAGARETMLGGHPRGAQGRSSEQARERARPRRTRAPARLPISSVSRRPGIEALARSLAADPADAQLRLDLCTALLAARRFEETAQTALEGLRMDPENGRLLLRLSEAKSYLGEPETALRLAAQAVRNQKSRRAVLHLTKLAALCRRFQRSDGARLRHALEARLHEPAFLYAAGVYEALYGSPRSALRLLEAALRHEKNPRWRRAISHDVARLRSSGGLSAAESTALSA